MEGSKNYFTLDFVSRKKIHPEVIENVDDIYRIDAERDLIFPTMITGDDICRHTSTMGDYKLDYECLSFGNATAIHFHAACVPGVKFKVLAMYYAATVFYDNAMQAKEKLDLWEVPICGQPLYKWIDELFTKECTKISNEGQKIIKASMKKHLRAMIDYHLDRRRDGKALAKDVYRSGNEEEYLRGRDRDGCFSGALFGALAAHGVDFREIDPEIFWATIKASILSFDIHGHYRHSAEKETSDTVNFYRAKLGVSFSDAVTILLDQLKVLFNLIVANESLSYDAKTGLTRYIMGLATLQYHTVRYYRGTAVHHEHELGMSPTGLSKFFTHAYLADGTQVPVISEVASFKK